MVVVLAACPLIALVAFAAGRANAVGEKVLRAEKLELMSGGKVAAVLRASDDGLEVRGPDGKLRALVGFALDRVAALTLLDETGHGRISLSMEPSGEAGITMWNGDLTRQLSLTAPSKGGPGIYLESGENGKYIALDDEGRLVSSMGCGVEAYVIAPASPPVGQ